MDWCLAPEAGGIIDLSTRRAWTGRQTRPRGGGKGFDTASRLDGTAGRPLSSIPGRHRQLSHITLDDGLLSHRVAKRRDRSLREGSGRRVVWQRVALLSRIRRPHGWGRKKVRWGFFGRRKRVGRLDDTEDNRAWVWSHHRQPPHLMEDSRNWPSHPPSLLHSALHDPEAEDLPRLASCRGMR